MRWDKNYKNPDPIINDPVIIPVYGVTDEERARWNAKQNALEYDEKPTQYSDKHLISGAIYNALEYYKTVTTQACQDYFWGVAGGLGEVVELANTAVETANEAKDAAIDAKDNAAVSANDASLSAIRALDSKNYAVTAATTAGTRAEDAEAWAKGTRNGVPVPTTDPAYNNNAKYWAQQGSPSALAGLSDTNIVNPTNGQTLVWNATTQQWENKNASAASLSGMTDVELGLWMPLDSGQVLVYDGTEWVNDEIITGGSKITITTTEISMYGKSVTITDGAEILTGEFDNTGECIFNNVTLTGLLTVNCMGYLAALNVPYFGNYTATISAFSAEITVTFPANSTCTCAKSGGISYTTSTSPYTFTVFETGTYVITATDGVHTKTTTVVITTDGQTESVTLNYVPDGSTVTPINDVPTWLQCADITDKSYTTLSEIFADSTTLSALIADNNATNYLVRSTDWTTSVCSNSGAMTYIGLNNYCSNTLIADDDWCTAINASAYMESVLNVKIPIMTSDNEPSGLSFGTGLLVGYYSFTAFAGDGYTSAVDTGGFVGYKFDSPVKICLAKVFALVDPDDASIDRSIKFQLSTNGTGNWQDFTDTITAHGYSAIYNMSSIRTTAYMYFRALHLDATGKLVIGGINLWGRVDV